MEGMTTVFTVGHGTRSGVDFLAVLATASIARVVDVRRHPGSRRHPHFGSDALARWLPDAGITYDFRGDVLGGRRTPSPRSRHGAWREPAFRGYADHLDEPATRAAVLALLDAAARQPTAILCAETLWWRCHRRLIADACVARGARVVHLLSTTSQQDHLLGGFARIGDDGWPVYDVGCLPGV
jgi:uncharacterized protein (DUF488 family)